MTDDASCSNWERFFQHTRAFELEQLLHLRATCRTFRTAVERFARPRVDLAPAWQIESGSRDAVDRMASKLTRAPSALVRRTHRIECHASIDVSALGANEAVVHVADLRCVPAGVTRVTCVRPSTDRRPCADAALSFRWTCAPSELVVGARVRCEELGALPPTLAELTFAPDHLEPTDFSRLPAGLTSLRLPDRCVADVDVAALPRGLVRLRFGRRHRGSVALVDLPRSLTDLRLPDDARIGPFDASLLPRGLVRLRFGALFDRPVVARHLPRTLRRLRFGARFRRPLVLADLPSTLRTLTLGSRVFGRPDLSHLPRALNRLALGACDGACPRRLGRPELPPNLCELAFDAASLLHAPLGVGLDLGFLPRTLVRLDLGRDFNRPVLARTLPRTLRVLRFGPAFDQPLELAALPPDLLELDLGASFCHPVYARDLPRRLRSLVLGDAFPHPIALADLPPSLTFASLGLAHAHSVLRASLPAGLRELRAPERTEPGAGASHP